MRPAAKTIYFDLDDIVAVPPHRKRFGEINIAQNEKAGKFFNFETKHILVAKKPRLKPMQLQWVEFAMLQIWKNLLYPLKRKKGRYQNKVSCKSIYF